MSFSCGFYNSENGDREYFNEDLSNFLDGFIEDGVYEFIDDHMYVRATSTPSMNINVSSGRAWFNGTWTRIDAPYAVEIPAADAVLNRIDAVCLTINKTRAVRDNYIEIISGTRTAGTPTKPEVTNETNIYRYVLAYVTVSHGATAITQASIENRIGMDDCPFSKPIWENIPSTEDMVRQWQTQFDEFMTYIHQTFDYDAAGNLLTQIDSLRIKYVDCDVPIDSTSTSAIAHVRYDEEFAFSLGAFVVINFSDLTLNGASKTIQLAINEETAGLSPRSITIPPFNASSGVCIYRCGKRTNNGIEEEFFDLVSWGNLSQAALNFSDVESADLDASKMAVATPKALHDMKVEMQASFQAGVDAVYNACVAEGVTPSASTPTAIAQAIAKIRNGGDATAAQILSGKKAYSAKNFITGTMANRGNWTGATSGSGNVTIPAGYHAGGGYVSGAGAYNAGYAAGYAAMKNNALYITNTYGSDISSQASNINSRSNSRAGKEWRQGTDDNYVKGKVNTIRNDLDFIATGISNA